MKRITTFLWFDNEAEEAVNFYRGVFGDVKIGDISRYTTETPSHKPIGSVMTVEFELFGQKFAALNGGPYFKFNESVSFLVECKDQEELDKYWSALSAVPESEQCGWLKDKFGVSWQIVPEALNKMLRDENKEVANRVMQEMLKMKKIVIADLEKAYKG